MARLVVLLVALVAAMAQAFAPNATPMTRSGELLYRFCWCTGGENNAAWKTDGPDDEYAR